MLFNFQSRWLDCSGIFLMLCQVRIGDGEHVHYFFVALERLPAHELLEKHLHTLVAMLVAQCGVAVLSVL